MTRSNIATVVNMTFHETKIKIHYMRALAVSIHHSFADNTFHITVGKH